MKSGSVVQIVLAGVLLLLSRQADGQLRFEMGRHIGGYGGRWAYGPIDFSPDSNLFAFASSSALVKVWDLSAKREINSFEYPAEGGARRRVSQLQFADATTIAVGVYGPRGDDADLLLSDVTKGTRLATVPLARATIRAMAFSPDGAKLVAAHRMQGRREDEVRAWDNHTGKLLSLLDTAQCSDVQFSRDGRWLATVHGVTDAKGQIFLWDAATFERRRAIRASGGWILLAFSPDGKFLAAAINRQNNSVRPEPGVELWDVETGKNVGWLDGYQGAPRAEASVFPAWGSDSRFLVATCQSLPPRDALIKLWDVSLGEQRVLDRTELWASAVFSPDGKWLATPFTGPAPGVKLWDAKSWQLKRTLDMSNDSDRQPKAFLPAPVLRLLFSPDGRWLAAIRGPHNAEQEAVVWDLSEDAQSEKTTSVVD